MAPKDKKTSLTTTEGIGRAPNRAMLRAVGFHDDDFDRPIIGVASLFSDITLAMRTSTGLPEKGLKEFEQVAVCPKSTVHPSLLMES